MIPWELGKKLDSLCNPVTIATETEAHKVEKHRKFLSNGYHFQSMALEVQGLLDESSEIFIPRLF